MKLINLFVVCFVFIGVISPLTFADTDASNPFREDLYTPYNGEQCSIKCHTWACYGCGCYVDFHKLRGTDFCKYNVMEFSRAAVMECADNIENFAKLSFLTKF